MVFAGLTFLLLAGALPLDQAKLHVGEVATIEGTAHIDRTPAGEVYIDLGGQGESAPLSAYISRWNRVTFQDVGYLNGRKVRITGWISTFRGRPEIFLTSPDQLTAK